jgi:predicted nucleic acid-binding protein
LQQSWLTKARRARSVNGLASPRHGCEFTIQLTPEQKADVLIMDERRGRAIAQRRGLPLTGALGVLGDAYRRALIDYPLDVLTDIRQQGFRISDALVARFEALLISRYAR